MKAVASFEDELLNASLTAILRISDTSIVPLRRHRISSTFHRLLVARSGVATVAVALCVTLFGAGMIINTERYAATRKASSFHSAGKRHVAVLGRSLLTSIRTPKSVKGLGTGEKNADSGRSVLPLRQSARVQRSPKLDIAPGSIVAASQSLSRTITAPVLHEVKVPAFADSPNPVLANSPIQLAPIGSALKGTPFSEANDHTLSTQRDRRDGVDAIRSLRRQW